MLDCLTPKRIVILQMVASDLSQKEIGAIIGISVKNVNTHIHFIKKILNVNGIAGMTKVAVQNGLTKTRLGTDDFKKLWESTK